MSISKDEVKHIANLSKLNLTDEELEKYTNELSDIVDMANQLSSIDVEGVKPTAHILNIQNVFREDIQISKTYLGRIYSSHLTIEN